MRTVLRWVGYFAGFLLLLIVLAAAYVWIVSSNSLTKRADAHTETLAAATPAQLADGTRQLSILGCVSCHGEGLRGKLFFDVPNVAKLYAPNLTLIAAHADDQRLAQAIRQGVGHDGRPLWAMPSGMFSRLEDGEVAALIAWMRTLPRAGAPTPPVSVGPIGRLGMALGKFEPAPVVLQRFRRVEPIFAGSEHESGRRLAARACAECHGPSLEGGNAGPHAVAPDLAIAGGYDLDQFRTLMRTGVPPTGRDLGLMKTVSVQDFSSLRPDEVAALHGYLSARAERVGQ